MKKVRVGILGLGVEGKLYAEDIAGGKVKNMELAAVYNRSEKGREWASEKLPSSVRIYGDAEELMKDSSVDAIIITLPHYLHPEYAAKAFSHHLHVLTDKPAGVYTEQILPMNQAAADSDRVFGIMWNVRADPLYRKVKEFMESGALGEVRRVVWEVTAWYRTQKYYDSADWRATWKGEGGGVLMNQCPHNLDILQWIFGMPVSVRAFCKYGNHRNIEVENDATAYMEFENGATGVFITSTHECPGTNRLEVSGDNGKLLIENGKITFYRLTVPEQKFNEYCGTLFDEPKWEEIDILPDKKEKEGYILILENFADAILSGTPLIAPGEEGIREAMLCNAIQMSDWTGEILNPLTLDGKRFKEILDEKIRLSESQNKKEEQKQ